MKTFVVKAATALAVTLTAMPCRAAEDRPVTHNLERQTSAFAGVNIRLPLGGKERAKPAARLQMGMVWRSEGAGPRSPDLRYRPGGLEFGLTAKGRPEIYVNGQSAGQMRERLKLGGSEANAAMIVFSVVLLAVGILVITNLDDLGDPGS